MGLPWTQGQSCPHVGKALLDDARGLRDSLMTRYMEFTFFVLAARQWLSRFCIACSDPSSCTYVKL